MGQECREIDCRLRLLHSELPILWLLFEGGNYSKAVSNQRNTINDTSMIAAPLLYLAMCKRCHVCTWITSLGAVCREDRVYVPSNDNCTLFINWIVCDLFMCNRCDFQVPLYSLEVCSATIWIYIIQFGTPCPNKFWSTTSQLCTASESHHTHSTHVHLVHVYAFWWSSQWPPVVYAGIKP